MAAILYVFRTLVDDEIPLNAGCLEPIEVTIPEGSMLAPELSDAVVAGNGFRRGGDRGAVRRARGAGRGRAR